MKPGKPLSCRELECLQHASLGKSIRETAQALRIGEETVKTHRSHILRKLECKTINAALVEAIRMGAFMI